MKNLGKKTASGLLYKFAERISVQAANFIVSIVLARILMPEDYGTIALVTVLITILDVFVTYGFGNSLVVNKKSDNLDFSTCFWFGIFLSAVIYAGVYYSAPYIADHYETPILLPVIRVMALRIPISAITNIQHAYVKKQMMFRKFFISTSIGTITSGVVALIMAYTGFGIWALVTQYLGNVIIDTICLSFIVNWKPEFIFSFKRLKVIYDYGWKILCVGLLDNIYNQLRKFLIADRYSKADLAYYSRGAHFPEAGMYAIIPTIDSVVFPALSNCNDNQEQMKKMTRILIKCATFITIPILVLIFSVSKSLVLVLLTEKWEPSIIYVQITALAFLLRPVQTINNCVIRASGRSGLFLTLDVIKKGVGIALLIASIPFGVPAIAASLIVVNYFSTFVNIWPNRKILNYGYREQLADIFPNIGLSATMGAIVWAVTLLPLDWITILCIQIVVGILSYWGLAVLTKSESYSLLKSHMLGMLKKKIKKQ